MTIYLVRHGETIFNARRVLQFPDTPLSERGIEQAERLAERLADAGIVRILSSDHLRAVATAQAIRKAVVETRERISSDRARSPQEIPLEIDPVLRERNFGGYRGRSYDDLDEEVFAPDHIPPEGESVIAFEARIVDVWERILAAAAAVEAEAEAERSDPENESRRSPALAVVSHGLVCEALSRNHLPLPPAVDLADIQWLNTCVTEIERDVDGRWQVTRLACAAHLEGMDAPDPSTLGHV